MAIICVVRSSDDELVATIVAEMSDPCPDGCYFVEVPPEHTWHNGRVVSVFEVLTGTKQLQVF